MIPADVGQIQHIARLAVLAMCARGVAAGEFEASPEIREVRFTVIRDTDTLEFPVEVEFIGSHSIPVGGMSL